MPVDKLTPFRGANNTKRFLVYVNPLTFRQLRPFCSNGYATFSEVSVLEYQM